MYKRAGKNIQHAVNARTDFNNEFGHYYPPYLHKDYANYKNSYTPSEYYHILVKREIDECRIEKSMKDLDYKIWFGKYAGTPVFEMDDIGYLEYICDMFRKDAKKKKLIGQILLRLDEL